MKVLVLTTWENPKSDEGLKKYWDFMEKHRKYMTERINKYNVKRSGWADGTGKVYNLREFESYDAYAKFFDDEESHRIWINFSRLVNNLKIKVLRESFKSPS